MSLPDLIGHQENRQRLAQAARTGRLAQVLLLTGPAGVGKQRFALWLAQLALCERRELEPCGLCRACRLVAGLGHPDVHWFVPIPRPKAGAPDKQVDEAAESLAGIMEERRQQPLYTAPDGMASHPMASVRLLQRRASLTAVEGGPRVFIVGEADRLAEVLVPVVARQLGTDRRLGEQRFAVAGTPTDAVMMALAYVMKDARPDLILSGINRGANLAEDATYSGTVSAAMEGALAGVHSIALSQAYSREGLGDSVPYAAAEAWAERVLAPLIDAPMSPGTLVNVNFPALPPGEVRGIRVVSQGIRDYGRLRIDKRTDPRGFLLRLRR